MKLKFSVGYKTKWGHSLHVVVTYIRTDGHKDRHDLLMFTDDGNMWTLETASHETSKCSTSFITYYYQIEDAHNEFIAREWVRIPRIFNFDNTKDYQFSDVWRHVPMEFSYGNRLQKNNTEDCLPEVLKTITMPLYLRTMVFRVSAPQLRQGDAVGILGNHPVLGNWNEHHILRMIHIGEHEWMLSVNLYELYQPLEYKYVVIDGATNRLSHWEEGTNRCVGNLRIYDNEVLSFYDGDMRLRESDRLARITIDTDNPTALMEWARGETAQINRFEWITKDKMDLTTQKKKTYDTYIFDLDGTLLNTLHDLAASCNYALRESGLPERTIDEVKRFVGNGVKKLMERAIPNGTDNPKFEKAYNTFRQHYLVHSLDTTEPYPGVMNMLKELKREGKNIAVVSNKFYAATQELCRHFFGEYVEVAIGERENIRKKPAPDTVVEALRQLGVTKENAVYVGDSDVDVATAKNSEMPCISVLWGFRDRDFLLAHGATTFISSPKELLNM